MSEAVNLWREKLEFLLAEEAKASDAGQKFELRKDIAEARAKLSELASKAPAASSNAEHSQTFQADISRIIKYAPVELIGRGSELKVLSDAWQQAVNGENKRPRILTFVALGGEGKTSLVAKWAADLAYQGWPACDAAFAWSFYSQGTSEKTQASSDSFLKEALLFFGDVEMANSAASSFDKGRRLAQLVGEQRSLLILDGVEPLQYSSSSPTGSELKDQGVAALLRALASNNNGLCVVTTRYSIPDLRSLWQTTAREIKLSSLSIDAGVALLRRLGVKGTSREFEQLVRDVKGHALTLNLLGSFLRDAHAGDIRKRDLVRLEEADAEEQGGHAFHVMDAYVESFKREGEKGTRALSVLGLLGLFDRPASVDCLNALWTGEEIGGLTGPLLSISEAQRNITFKRLEDAGLITVNRNEASELVSLDAHPLLREYFASQVRQQLPEAWRAAHRRLYEYLRDTTPDKPEPTLEDLQPLYQAVAHGCRAGLAQEVLHKVYIGRLLRHHEYYTIRKLGAQGSDLTVLACFFESPWTFLSPFLQRSEGVWVKHDTSFRLGAMGRLSEAINLIRDVLSDAIDQERWVDASTAAANLSEFQLTLGDLDKATSNAKDAVKFADADGGPFERLLKRSKLAHVLHMKGDRKNAQKYFEEAEYLQTESEPGYGLLYSYQGFVYSDLLLAISERAAWRVVLELPTGEPQLKLASDNCDFVLQRISKTLDWAVNEFNFPIFDVALDYLSLSRASLYNDILKSDFSSSNSTIQTAIDGLRLAGYSIHLPGALLTHAWVHVKIPHKTLLNARQDLDDAWLIAKRGPMRLYMADIHLYRARLFHAVRPYPWNKFADGSEGRGPKDDLADARKLIEQCGYWRRKEELEDAEQAAKGWT